jgi:hypothetical protein
MARSATLDVGHSIQEETAAGGSKVNQDLANLEREFAKLKEEIKRMKMKVKQFPPSVKKGKLLLLRDTMTQNMFNIPDGIIAHLTRACGGNVHDYQVIDVTCGSFEKEILGANPHSGAYNNRPTCAAKNATVFEIESYFC